VVRLASYVIDANATSGMLPPAEMRRVNDWLDAMEAGYGDRIAVDESAASNGRAARDAVAMLVARKGLLLAEHAPVTSGNIQPGFIRIVITRSTASVPSCPNWATRMTANNYNSTTSNYGCATNANIAAMVADASDLVRGQNSGENDPLTASKAIESYRTNPPTGAGGLSNISPSGGGSSGGGQ
jgi:pilus assembly protein CpaD